MEIRSAKKYLGNSMFKQLCHMTSELLEVWVAFIIYILNPNYLNKWLFASEVVDLQSSGQTMLEGPLELDKNHIDSCRECVVSKNNRRGYYQEANQ